MLGLSAALALAETGVSVRVLEAQDIGAGASGRSGGLVVPSLPRIGPDEARAALGEAYGDRLLALVAGGAAATFDLIRRHAIACDARQSGWLHPAHAPALAPRVAARVAAWQAAGARCAWLDAAATQARMGSAAFFGALFDPTGGHLDPLGYTRGLARAAIAAGAVVHAASPVTAIARAGAWRLATPRGVLRAASVLQCTNATPPGLPSAAGRAVRDSTVPLVVYQVATEILPDAARRAVLAGGEAFSDTRHNLFAGRWTTEGRFVTGGMAALQAGALHRLPGALARRLAANFPALGEVRIASVWRGRAALTGDFLPRLMQPAPGWLAPVACNGRGIVLATVLGPALAAFLRSGDAASLPLPLVPPRPLPLPRLARLLPQLLLPLGDLADRRAGRQPAQASWFQA